MKPSDWLRNYVKENWFEELDKKFIDKAEVLKIIDDVMDKAVDKPNDIEDWCNLFFDAWKELKKKVQE